MKLVKYLFLMPLLAIAGGASGSAPCKMSKTKAYGIPAVSMENSFLKLTVLPDSNGRIANIKYIPADTELLRPYREERKVIDPLLPKMISSNLGGYKEWLWGVRPIYNTMKIVGLKSAPKRIELGLDCKYYMSKLLDLKRNIILNRDSSSILIKTRLKNIGKKAQDVKLWVNTIPDTTVKTGSTVYPVKGGVKFIDRYSTLYSKEDCLHKFRDNAESNFFATVAQPWCARVFEDKNFVMVYSFATQNNSSDMMFYSWKGKSDGIPCITIETIYPSIKLQPGKTAEYTTKVMVFKGLSNISGLCGDVAIDCEVQQEKDEIQAFLTLVSCRKLAANKLRLWLVDSKTNRRVKSSVITKQVAALQPGDKMKVCFTFPLKDIKRGKYKIAGRFFEYGSFLLLAPDITVNEN